MKGFAWLKIYGTVLNLYQDVVPECAVKRHKFIVSLFCPVHGHVVVINEGSPHHNTAVRGDGICKHVCTVGMRAAVILRSGLPLGVGLDKEPPEIGNERIYLGSLLLPPA